MATTRVNTFNKALQNLDFAMGYDNGETGVANFGDVVCKSGQYTKIGEYRVLYNNTLVFGQEGYKNYDDRGTATIVLYDDSATPVQITDGNLRLSLIDSNNQTTNVSFDDAVTVWAGGKKISADLTHKGTYQMKLVLEYQPLQSDVTVGTDNCSVTVPVTNSQLLGA